MDVILFWNDVALEVHRQDFSREDGKPEVGGPTRVSRALAIVHAAMYNAQEAVAPRAGGPRFYLPTGLPTPLVNGSVSAAGAVAGAAVACLKKLWPAQAAFIDRRLQVFCDQRLVSGGETPASLAAGADHGEVIGLAMFDHRQSDGHERPDEKVYLAWPLHHRPDPTQPDQARLSTHWGRLRPFLIPTPPGGVVDHTQYLGPPPTAGARYETAVADVLALGRANAAPVAGERTPEQTVVGTFWGYDGSPQLGVPPRLYNQTVRALVSAQAAAGVSLSDAEAAHLFALVNMAMADAGIVAWGAKYYHDLWRPVVGIREHDPGYGPNHGIASGALAANADPGWLPLGIPRTNVKGDYWRTPDFPAYPSGHATFGAASFRVAALFYAKKKGTSTKDELEFPFVFVSDEYNGRNVDPRGDVRPVLKQELRLGEAIVANSVSRVYLGVHWRYDGLGTVAPDRLEGSASLPADPASGVSLPAAAEQRLGGVPAGLRVADEAMQALP